VSPAEAQNDRILRRAIADRRLVAFRFDGLPRVGEPHDYGIAQSALRLLFYQVGGESRSGRPVGWRLVATARITDLEILHGPDDRFPGTRPAPSGRHRRWDRIIASVSIRPSRDDDG
jgi:hypothetical protein